MSKEKLLESFRKIAGLSERVSVDDTQHHDFSTNTPLGRPTDQAGRDALAKKAREQRARTRQILSKGNQGNRRGRSSTVWSYDVNKHFQLDEGRMAEVDQIMQDIASGELDPQDIVHNPKTPVEQYAAQQLQSMYDRVMEDPDMMQRYGIRSGDDDFEQVWSAVCDMVAQDYGTDIGTPSPRMEGAVLIGMTMDDIRKVAGLQESFEDRLEAAREKARAKGKIKDEDKEEKKPAVRKVSGSSYGGSKQKEDTDEGSGKPAPAEKKEEAPKAEPKKEAAPKAEKPAASGTSFSAIAKQVLKSGGGAAAVKAACQKAGVTVPNHLHSRLNALKKNLKESFYIITHPQMPSFVLAENPMMNQYQWISSNEDNVSLLPVMFETVEGAEKLIKYIAEYKNQAGEITKVEM